MAIVRSSCRFVVQRPVKLRNEGAEILNCAFHNVADPARIGPCVQHVGDLVEVRALFAYFGLFPLATCPRPARWRPYKLAGQGFVVDGRLALAPGQGRIQKHVEANGAGGQVKASGPFSRPRLSGRACS